MVQDRLQNYYRRRSRLGMCFWGCDSGNVFWGTLRDRGCFLEEAHRLGTHFGGCPDIGDAFQEFRDSECPSGDIILGMCFGGH